MKHYDRKKNKMLAYMVGVLQQITTRTPYCLISFHRFCIPFRRSVEQASCNIARICFAVSVRNALPILDIQCAAAAYHCSR
jgi:hypothetical protein